MSKAGKKMIAAAQEALAIARGEMELARVRSYVSGQVFDGRRILSDARVVQLRETYRRTNPDER